MEEITPSATPLYSPLDNAARQVRLLNVLPAVNTSDALRCELVVATLDACPVYYALSYCWGDRHETETLDLNGRAVIVTRSVFNALLELRTKGLTSLWVDAICINQADVEEKATQVHRMTEIYTMAREVIAWLGPAGDDSHLAIELIKILSAGKKHPQYKAAKAEIDHWSHVDGAFLTHRRALQKLVTRPYWQRTWCVQEIVLATRVVVHCGNASISWEECVQAELYVPQIWSADVAARKVWMGFWKSSGKAGRTIAGLDQLRRERPGMPNLLEVLVRTHAHQATDARDRVYGLLGVASDGKQIIAQPSYDKTIEEIWIELTLGMIARKEDLTILMLKSMTPKERNLPSWVPDWDDLLGTGVVVGHSPVLKNLLYCPGGTLSRFFQEVYGPYETVDFKRDGNKLTMRAMYIDEIDGVSAPMPKIDQPEEPDITQPKYNASIYGTPEATARAMVKAMVGDAELPSGTIGPLTRLIDPANKEPSDFRRWYHHNAAFRFQGRSLADWLEVMRGINTYRARLGGVLGKGNTFMTRSTIESLDEAFRFRRRLITTKRGFVGQAHALAASGDGIWVIPGCISAAVCRKVDGGHRVIGHCLLSDYADGGLVKNDTEDDWHDLVLV